jgi:sulfate transport system permease protein
VDTLVDLPFALPTAVSGIALTTLFSANGWIGRYLDPLGIKVAYSQLGVVVALTFIGLPFVVRTVQPVLQEMDPEIEEAAASLGAGCRFRRSPARGLPAAHRVRWHSPEASGVRLRRFHIGKHADANGDRPLLIMTKLEQFDYEGATAIAVMMLVGPSSCCSPSTCSSGGAIGAASGTVTERIRIDLGG